MKYWTKVIEVDAEDSVDRDAVEYIAIYELNQIGFYNGTDVFCAMNTEALVSNLMDSMEEGIVSSFSVTPESVTIFMAEPNSSHYSFSSTSSRILVTFSCDSYPEQVLAELFRYKWQFNDTDR